MEFMENKESFRKKTVRSICRSLITSNGHSLATYRYSDGEVWLEIKNRDGSSTPLTGEEVMDLYELLKLSIDKADEA